MDPPKESFFAQLGKLAAKIERECAEYTLAVSEEREVCTSQTRKVISDLKREVKALETPLQTEHEKQKIERQKLDDITLAVNSFIDNHLATNVSQLEQYLAKYGYKPFEEHHASQAACKKQDDLPQGENMDKNEDSSVPKPPASKPPQDPNRTPRLEDAGISLDTLQFLNSLQKNKPATNRPGWTNIPAQFQHDGIICSPGLFKSMNADVSYSADLHSALASPAVHASLRKAKPLPVIEETRPSVEQQLPFNTDEISQPESPVLRTPGIKQMLSNTHSKHGNHSGASHDTSKRHVNVGLFKSNPMSKDAGTGQQEPNVPDFTPRYDDGEPIEPELTYSLEALSEMTGVYQINSAKKTQAFSNKPFANQPVATSNKENATPPEPEMLTDRMSRVKIQQESKTLKDFEPKQIICDDMPPSPKLLGDYDFLKH